MIELDGVIPLAHEEDTAGAITRKPQFSESEVGFLLMNRVNRLALQVSNDSQELVCTEQSDAARCLQLPEEAVLLCRLFIRCYFRHAQRPRWIPCTARELIWR
jgi:hypothetical protein